jgi:hypothetical protein
MAYGNAQHIYLNVRATFDTSNNLLSVRANIHLFAGLTTYILTQVVPFFQATGMSRPLNHAVSKIYNYKINNRPFNSVGNFCSRWNLKRKDKFHHNITYNAF